VPGAKDGEFPLVEESLCQGIIRHHPPLSPPPPLPLPPFPPGPAPVFYFNTNFPPARMLQLNEVLQSINARGAPRPPVVPLLPLSPLPPDNGV